MSTQYDWSYVRSEINPNDIEITDEKLFVLYNSLIVEFSLNGNELSRFDIKKEHNLNFISDIEIDSEDNIWLFGDSGDILVLNKNYDHIKDFTYLDIDQSNECINIQVEDDNIYFCTYIDNNDLGILEFNLSEASGPIYQEYYPIHQIDDVGDLIIDLDSTDDEIFLTTNQGVYVASVNSNLKLPDSWSVCSNSGNVIATLDLNEIFIFISSPDNSEISIINKNGEVVEALNYSPDDLLDVILFNGSYIGLLFNDEILIFSILDYTESSINIELSSSHTLSNGIYKLLRSYDDNLIVTIYNQGFQIIPSSGEIIHLTPNSPSIDGFSTIKLLDDGFVAAGILENENIFSAATLHFDGESYVNYIPTEQTNEYNTENEFDAVFIDYKVGAFLPLSIVDMGNEHILFSNSGLIPSSDNAGGIIELDLANRELVNIFNSDNTEVLGGLNGIYNVDWTTNYLVVNQIIKHDGKIWIVNPYNVYYGNIICTYDIDTQIWSSLNASDEYLYLPQEIAFDNSGQIWTSFDYEQTLSSSQLDYSMGGIRYVNTNNQFVEVSNDEDLLGGERADVWALDICDYNGFDILWVITNDGVQGYTIFQNELAPISNLDLFTEVQFSKGDHIRCDDFSNVWITTRHSGARVILSGENYADYWPSYIGLTSDNSGLLSDVIYDIDFDKNTGEVYFATDMGISILSSPFSDIQHTSNDEYNIHFSNNPFLVPKDEEVNIRNIPVGSTIKIMNLRGKILHTMKNENYTEYQWNGRDRNGKYVNSGVYIVTSSHPDYKTVVGKLAIIREQ